MASNEDLTWFLELLLSGKLSGDDAISKKFRNNWVLLNKLQLLFDKTPPRTGLEILVEDEHLILCGENKKKLDLLTLVPSGYKFVSSDNYQHDGSINQIYYKLEDLPNKTFLLSIFHEMGHANQDLDYLKKITTFSLREEIMSRLQAEVKQTLWINKRKKECETQKTPHWLEELKDCPETKIAFEFIFYPQRFIEKKGKVEVRKERDAWAWALRKMRRLEDNGFPVFNGFANKFEIKLYTNLFCLSTYSAYWDLIKSNSKKLEDELYAQKT